MSNNEQIDPELLKKTIGIAARAARKRLDLTQEEVAKRLSCSAEFYARIERGHAFPSVATFNRIVDVLEVSGDELLGLKSGDGESPRAGRVPAGLEELSPELRRLLGRLRLAAPDTIRVATAVAKELERANNEDE